jgi:hypothetical protein
MEPSGWAEDLSDYSKSNIKNNIPSLPSTYALRIVQAVQDSDYMGRHIWQAQDPFIVTGERYIDRLMLEVAMKNKENVKDPLGWTKSMFEWEAPDVTPKPIGGTRDRELTAGVDYRLSTAIGHSHCRRHLPRAYVADGSTEHSTLL